jgi:hypothetical protein
MIKGQSGGPLLSPINEVLGVNKSWWNKNKTKKLTLSGANCYCSIPPWYPYIEKEVEKYYESNTP